MESPFKEDILKGKVALITGGASGIGFEISTQFGKHGASVALMGRRKQVLDSAVSVLQSLGIPVCHCFIFESSSHILDTFLCLNRPPPAVIRIHKWEFTYITGREMYKWEFTYITGREMLRGLTFCETPCQLTTHPPLNGARLDHTRFNGG